MSANSEKPAPEQTELPMDEPVDQDQSDAQDQTDTKTTVPPTEPATPEAEPASEPTTPAVESTPESNETVTGADAEPTPSTIPGAELKQRIAEVSHKDSESLEALDRAISEAPAEEQAELRESLTPLLEKHAEWQKTLLEKAETLLASLDKALQEGHIRDVQSFSDRSQNTVNKLRGEISKRMQEKLAPLSARVTELLDWKRFADTEKKKDLLASMEKLVDNDMHLGTRAKKIRNLQDEWRKLGHAEDNETLWQQFSETAKKAFEPCKAYFHERKELMRNNLIERNKIIEQLDAYVEDVADKPVNVPEVNKLEKEARELWKKFAPVQQNKIKDLQARFNAVMKRLRQHRHQVLEENARLKTQLVSDAKLLLDEENIHQATSQAKQLQQQWKKIGPAPHKAERQLWNDFRGACDKLFARRDEQSDQARQEEQAALQEARQQLQKLAALLDLPDEQFVESRKEYSELKKAIEAALPDSKGRPGPELRKTQDRFAHLTRRYEQRRRAAPDKKQLQLQSQLESITGLCQRAEEQLLNGDTAALPDADSLQAEWDALTLPEDKTLAQAMKKRFAALLSNLDKPEAMQKLATEKEQEARTLCVEMEIQAGLESPAEDKAIRMQCQLNHLKHGLGQNTLQGKERAQRINDMALAFDCVGPLPSTLRNTLKERISRIRQAVA